MCVTINLDGGTITSFIKAKKRCLVKPPPGTKQNRFLLTVKTSFLKGHQKGVGQKGVFEH